jgi:hypothetical protein
MRFLETLLLVFALIYVAQLIIVALILATLLLFLWCLWKRPREALMLGLGALVVVVLSKPIGLILVGCMALGVAGWLFVRWAMSRRGRTAPMPPPRLPRP